MQTYKNSKSGILSFEIMRDAVKVEFKNGTCYVYTYASAGRDNIEKMKLLAREGQGLNTFISTRVHKDFALRLK